MPYSPVQSVSEADTLFTCSSPNDLVISPGSPIIFDWPAQHDGGESTSDLIRRNSNTSLIPQLRSLPPASPAVSPRLEFHMPAFSEFTARPNRRALVDHFCNVLSRLIVFREESGNPFQQLVLPLARQSSPVMNAIYALASAHMEYRGVNTGEKSLSFHNRAIQDLARLIQRGDKVNKNELLAAIMLLVYYEVVSIPPVNIRTPAI